VILARICRLVLERLYEAIEENSEERPEGRTNPVDPMIAVELSEDNVWTKTASWVEGSAGEPYASKMGDEECETNTERRDERGFVLFSCEHESISLSQHIKQYANKRWPTL